MLERRRLEDLTRDRNMPRGFGELPPETPWTAIDIGDISQVPPIFSFLTADQKEIMRISRSNEGRLEVTITGELYEAAPLFWDVLKQFVKASDEGTIEVRA